MNTSHAAQAVLILENGTALWGLSVGSTRHDVVAEVVFTTGMTGYQETLTDPSYCQQILVTTAAHIGNTGWNTEDNENLDGRIWVAGLIMRNMTRHVQHYRATTTLQATLEEHNVPAIEGIDTRALVRILRSEGSMRGGIFTYPGGGSKTEFVAEKLAQVHNSPTMNGANFTDDVSTAHPYTVEPIGQEVASIGIIDLGVKSSAPRLFAERGVRCHVLPHTVSLADFRDLKVSGLLIPNGPGDPKTATGPVALVREALAEDIPIMGICFGNQILGQALGRTTYKMPFGHRGINIPVKDTAVDRVIITAQNHGFALKGEPGERFDTDFGPAELSHFCPMDGTIEGVRLLSGRAFAVQYHPEAHAGPHDGESLFDKFVSLVTAS